MIKLFKLLGNKIQPPSHFDMDTKQDVEAHLSNPAIRRHFLKIVKQDGMLLRMFHPSVRRDKEIVATAVLNSPQAFTFASESLRLDSEFTAQLVSVRGEILAYAPPSKQKNHNVVWQAVRQNGLALKYAHSSMKKDPRIALRALKSTPEAFKLLHPALKTNKTFIKWAIETNGHTIRYIAEYFRQDKDIVKLAISSAPEALDHVDMALQGDEDLIVECVKTHGPSLLEKHPEYLHKKAVANVALRHNGLTLRNLKEEFRNDRELVLTAVRQNGFSIIYANPEFLSDPLVVEAALRNDPSVFSLVDKQFRTNRRLVYIAVAQRGFELKYADPELKKEKHLGLLAIRQNPSAFHHIDDSLKEDVHFIREALSINKDIATYIHSEHPDIVSMVKGAQKHQHCEEEQLLGLTPSVSEDSESTIAETGSVSVKASPTVSSVSISASESGTQVKATTQDGNSIDKTRNSVLLSQDGVQEAATTEKSHTDTATSNSVEQNLDTSSNTLTTQKCSSQKEKTVSNKETRLFVREDKGTSLPPRKMVSSLFEVPKEEATITEHSEKRKSVDQKDTEVKTPNGDVNRSSTCTTTTNSEDVTVIEKESSTPNTKGEKMVQIKDEDEVSTTSTTSDGKSCTATDNRTSLTTISVSKNGTPRIDRSSIHTRRYLTKDNKHSRSAGHATLLQRRLGQKNAKVTVVTDRNKIGRKMPRKKSDSALPLKVPVEREEELVHISMKPSQSMTPRTADTESSSIASTPNRRLSVESDSGLDLEESRIADHIMDDM